MMQLIVFMDKIKKHPFILYYLFSSIYIIISIVLGLILGNGLVIFLGWNMVLATFVLVLSEIVHHTIEKNKSKGLIISSIFMWVLFFPNAFYILTDFIHFQNYTYFLSYPDLYAFKFADWLVFFHVVIGALIALKLGILSINHLIKHIKKNTIIYLSVLFLASSFGIYLGRFIRLNSWDIFKFQLIIQTVFDRFWFMIGFVSLFFIIHWMSYILFKDKKSI